ncbi:transposable element Tcb2 transposase [Trichonephila clavipes]|nr:transposable element Tcb2 transposase [Trichonephila clavipes]
MNLPIDNSMEDGILEVINLNTRWIIQDTMYTLISVYHPLIIIRPFLLSGRPCIRETESHSNDQRFCDRTDHQIGTSVHAPQRPMVTCIMMGTVVPGPHDNFRCYLHGSGWSARRVARQLGRSDCVTSRREDRHIVRNARVQPTASSAAIQAQIAPSLGAPVSSRTVRRRLAEEHLGSLRPLRVLPLTPTHRRLRLEWCHARGNWTAAEWNLVVFSDARAREIQIQSQQ